MGNRLLSLTMALPLLASAPAATVEAMKHHRRVVLIAAPTPADPHLLRQRRLLIRWQHGAAQRDISLVEIGGSQVWGVAEPASALRRAWRLPVSVFQVVLIGKDGHEALRQSETLSTDDLQRTIDAMPMRRAGLR